MEIWISRLYILVLSGMAIYGLLGVLTLWLYWRHKDATFPTPLVDEDQLPVVTVQLPMFNEQFVVERLIAAAIALDYPKDRLEIQVVDDSADSTTTLARSLVNQYQAAGYDIKLLHREDREGYKAGALDLATQSARGDFIAIFDADFAPEPDFLRNTIPHFIKEDNLGMIQVRWGHLNAWDSALTLAQAIAIDKHFAMEQTVRHRADLFPKFNGSGGIWRSRCLRDAGGWQADTVCEDLCLSTRALLDGWEFKYLDDVIAPAELPNTISGYKNQQARWAKGSIQCFNKFFWSILTAREHSLTARIYALVAMGAYFANGLLVALLILQIPMLLLEVKLSPVLWLLTAIGLGHPLMFILGQQVLYEDWLSRLRHFPTLLLITVGLAPSQIRAIIEALLPIHHVFVRTPKGAGQGRQYKLPFDWIILIELLLALYAAIGFGLSVSYQNVLLGFLFGWCGIGFAYVGVLGVLEQFGAGKGSEV